jgi:LPXTG-motif cell wall-anchored protein
MPKTGESKTEWTYLLAVISLIALLIIIKKRLEGRAEVS